MKTQISFLDVPEVTHPLAGRYQDLHDAVNAFTAQALEFRNSMAIRDEASRALYTAVSRMTAYSDQMLMILSLMGEDMHVAEELGSEPAPEFESTEHENCFYEWLRKSRNGGVVVN